MSDKAKNLVILLIVLGALVGVGVAAATKPAVLGLDLQGGLEVTKEAHVPRGQHMTAADFQTALATTKNVMSNRVDQLGLSSPDIRTEGTNRITIALPGVKDIKRAESIIGKTAQLLLMPMQEQLVPGVSTGAVKDPTQPVQPFAHLSKYDLLNAAKGVKDSTGAAAKAYPAGWWAIDKNTKKAVFQTPANSERQLQRQLESKYDGKVPDSVVTFKQPAGTLIVTCTIGPNHVCPGIPQSAGSLPSGSNVWYLFRYPDDPNLVLKGSNLTSAKQDVDPQSGQTIVTMNFNGKGKSQFEAITKLLSQKGRQAAQLAGQNTSDPNVSQSFSQQFAVILDNNLATFPSIDFQQFPSGINADNGAEITNIGSLQEARDIALVLQSGSLPLDLTTLQSTQISATLGKASLRQGLIAGIAGLIAVMIYLIVIYRFLGIVADLALLIYAALFYGLIVLIPITMTLPGIAGMILTIGVAADANVVIFERIKEEVRIGKSVRAAIATGYQKGFHTIIDANVVTLITAAVLFVSGTGTVKGFAFTLAVGVLLSMFTAVFATRAMLGLLAGFKWFHNASFMGASANKVRWRMDIIGRRYLWFAISGIVILIGLGALATKGLNEGIDFKGGTRVTLSNVLKPASQPAVAGALTSSSDPRLRDAIVQGIGSSNNGNYSGFQIQTRTLDTQQLDQLRTDVSKIIGDTQASQVKQDVSSVSASLGSEILRSAVYAFIFSLILIVIYVTARFEFKYAMPMIVALLHDLLITIGVYAVTGREVTAATVAAVLTVLGYSLYDTIIVFDRVRENTPLLRKNSYAQIVNVSLWETLTRSINTSLITLVPILSLLLFGGSTLKDFAFALFIGIASGAYSSIFVAAPLLSMWKESEPEYKKRKGALAPVQKATLGLVDVPGAHHHKARTLDPTGLATVPEAETEAQDGVEAEPEPAEVGAGARGGDNGELSDSERAAREAARRRRQQRRGKGGGGGSRPPHRAR